MKSLVVKALTISACLGVFGLAIPQAFFTPPAIAQTQDSISNWGFSIKRVGYPGRIAKTEYGDYEAAGTWVAVEVVVQNRTNKRLKSSDGYGYIIFANIVDAKGQKHTMDKSEGTYIDKPFNPGEARSLILLFDIPSGMKATQLVISDSIFDDSNAVRFSLR